MKPSLSLVAWIVLSTLGCSAPQPPAAEPARVPVSSLVVRPTPFQPSITLFGEVEPSSRTPVRTAFTGRLVYPERFANGLVTGVAVRSGELLAEIDDPDLEHQMAAARLESAAADAEHERARRSHDAGILPEVDLERARVAAELARENLAAARTRLDRLRVIAPASGFLVVDQPLAPATEVDAGTTLAWVGGTGKPRVAAQAAGSDLSRLSPALEAECRLPGGEDPVAMARLIEVSRVVDTGGTARVVALVEDDWALPAPGAGLELRVLLPAIADALVVPDEAVQVRSGVASLYILEPEGEDLVATRRIVQTGGTSGGKTLIESGLAPGERVAVRGVDLLTDGVRATDVTNDELPSVASSRQD